MPLIPPAQKLAEEKEIQDEIEARLPQNNWLRAYGEVAVQKPTGNRQMGEHFYDKKNPYGKEILEKWMPIEQKVEDLLRKVGADKCEYSFVPGGTICFKYTP